MLKSCETKVSSSRVWRRDIFPSRYLASFSGSWNRATSPWEGSGNTWGDVSGVGMGCFVRLAGNWGSDRRTHDTSLFPNAGIEWRRIWGCKWILETAARMRVRCGMAVGKVQPLGLCHRQSTQDAGASQDSCCYFESLPSMEVETQKIV